MLNPIDLLPFRWPIASRLPLYCCNKPEREPYLACGIWRGCPPVFVIDFCWCIERFFEPPGAMKQYWPPLFIDFPNFTRNPNFTLH